MAKIENSLGIITTLTNQDNINIVKYINNYPSFEQPNIIETLNLLPSYTISEIESLWFVIYIWSGQEEDSPQLIGKIIYKIINVGKGKYGVGGIQLTEDNLLFISNTVISLEEIENNPLTQIYTIEDLQGLTVSQYINQLNPAFLFQDVDIAPRLIKITEIGEESDYLFLPPGGLYGQGQLQTIDTDFQLLNSNIDSGIDQDNIPTPYIFRLAEIGATSFEDDIPTLLAAHIASLNITVTEKQNVTFEVNDAEPEYNFDMTSSNWYGIADSGETLRQWIINQTSGMNETVITDFTNIDGRVRCNISHPTGLYLKFRNFVSITKINRCNISNLMLLDVRNNLLNTQSYIDSLEWGETAPNGIADLLFSQNPNSPIGTALGNLLTSKGYNVQY